MDIQTAVHILWDYMCLHQQPKKADVIIGFGCYNEDVARRCAQLFFEGYAPLILFTGALGRNTSSMWTESEATRFARIARGEGVPASAVMTEERSTNSGENLIYAKRLLQEKGIPVHRVIGVQKPYMERRLWAAFPVYWPEVEVTVTSWQQTYEEYLSGLHRWNRGERETISMIVGDFQRISRYAELGYQIPQPIPEETQVAFEYLGAQGYTEQLI